MDSQGTEKRVVRVTIFQQPYTLRAAGDPAETEAIAQGVNELMNAIADRSASSDPARVAVMAALHLADKVRALEARAKSLEARLGEYDARLGEYDARLEDAAARAEKAEQTVHTLESAAAEEQARTQETESEKVGNLRQRLEELDARLAALLDGSPR